MQNERARVADLAFQDYDFGHGVNVEDSGGWESTTYGTEWTRPVYVRTDEGDDIGSSAKLVFVVRFAPMTANVVEQYAIDHKGSVWGHAGQPSAIELALDALSLAVNCGGELDKSVYRAANDALRSLVDQINAFEDKLNERELVPTGDHYNSMMALLGVNKLSAKTRSRIESPPAESEVRRDQVENMTSSLSRPSPVAEIFRDAKALEQLGICLNCFFQDDATGKAYVIERSELTQLFMIGLTGCAIQGIADDLNADPDRLSRYEMIVIDSGNSHGDSWIATYHPKQQVLTFVDERAGQHNTRPAPQEVKTTTSVTTPA